MRRFALCAAHLLLLLLVLGHWPRLIIAAVSLQKLKPSEMRPYNETIPGTNVKFEMMPVPGGEFIMGSPATEPGRAPDEGPPHAVQIRPFWIGKFEVTWDEYDQFAFNTSLNEEREAQATKPATADAVTRPTPPYADESFGFGKGRMPAISITHHAAMEYCRWLSERTGKTYRLATEAEWEYACRAGSKTAYAFGDDVKKLGEYAWFADNADAQPHPVGRKKPNAWGLYDMHGNVAEWVLDEYDKDFYATLQARAVNPLRMPTEKRYPNVVRGGSWDDDAGRLRSAARRASTSEWSKRDPQRPQSIWWHTEAIMVGFRIVRPLEEYDNLKGLRSRVTKQSP
ncbi:MAG TPA: SUMF1/EgtB/PvdO family nonheme iron enzyme [Blastocatellia bacterium]|nr:SUMF1/EgtB/PvdO family nonheme iron enzyme [Blastocatellia bacterium]